MKNTNKKRKTLFKPLKIKFSICKCHNWCNSIKNTNKKRYKI